MAHHPHYPKEPPVAGPATDRGQTHRRLFDALYGRRVHPNSERGASLQKRQARGRPDAGPAGFALDSGPSALL